jgi:alpha-beta hydrolase superfamily lysophospholipase
MTLFYTLLACLLAAIGALYALQRKLMYFPRRLPPAEYAAEVGASFGGGARILGPFDAIVVEPPAGVATRGVAIWFHGNAGLGLDRAYVAPVFARRGLRLVLAEYPGYGARGGEPSERTLVADAQALYARVCDESGALPVMLVGESLGSGVAVAVASHEGRAPPARLVLLTPFLSVAETAARVYWFLPARVLVKDRYDSARHLPGYRGPVAILVAGRDEVIGASQGRALAELARARGETTVLELAEAGHNSWMPLLTGAQWTSLLATAPEAPGD